MMKRLISYFRKRYWVVIHDLLMTAAAWLGAYWVHYDFIRPFVSLMYRQAFILLPVTVLIQMIVATIFGLYRGSWQFASLPDLRLMIKAVSLGVLVLFGLFSVMGWIPQMPRSILPLYSLLLLVFWGGPRFLCRSLKEQQQFREAKRVLIIGAGKAAESLVRDLLRRSELSLMPVAYLDDTKIKLGQEIHGIRVAGSTQKIEHFVKAFDVDLIIIAIPSISVDDMCRIVEGCSRSGVPYRTLPSLQDLAEGRVDLKNLREVSIEDLLGRDTVDLDWISINQSLVGKKILVTGGGGSIGSELCRQIAKLGVRQLVIFEHSEFNLYQIVSELHKTFPGLNLGDELVDVSDYHTVNRLMEHYQPDIIFHAAAYKHVPILENKVLTATRNNVLGTRNMAELAHRHNVSTFVLVSTDKAVNPTNVMGLTKRLAEIFCQNLNTQSNTNFITVRFGNVLGSAGSVLPLFYKQLAEGGPLTVTHPDVTRFFMTMREAASLILQSASMGKGGEIYILDMGKPVNIRYLAEQVIKLSGKQLDEIKIQYTGLRAGEKMHEELFHEGEELLETAHQKIALANSRIYDWETVLAVFDSIRLAYENDLENELISYFRNLVPESHL